MIESQQSTYYTDIINEHSSDKRILFKTIGKLLQKSTNKRYPPSSDDTALANSFANFFASKVDKIHHGLVERKIRVGSSPPDVKVCGAEFCNFAEVTLEEIKKFSRKPLSKSCELDPLPAVVLKGCLTVLLPTIMRIINLSLSTGVVPDALMVAIPSPTLKKSDADFEQFQNFHPILNLKVPYKRCNAAAVLQQFTFMVAQRLSVCKAENVTFCALRKRCKILPR